MNDQTLPSARVQIIVGLTFLVVGCAMFPIAQTIDNGYMHNREVMEEAKQYPTSTWCTIVDSRVIGGGSAGPGVGFYGGHTEFTVTYKIADKSYESKLSVGLHELNINDKIQILYRPSNPTDVKIPTPYKIERPYRMPFIVLGCFIIAAGLGLFAYGIHRYHRSKLES